MAQALYDEVNGVYRKVTKKYDGVDGVARNVVKCYDGVEGVARQYFGSSGVQWKKYNCVQSSVYKLNSNPTATSKTETIRYRIGSNFAAFSSWKFSETDGLTGVARVTLAVTADVTAEEVSEFYVGKYGGENRMIIYKFASVDSYSNDGTYATVKTTKKVYKSASITTIYEKGSTSYGTVTAPEGELPEDGTLIEGSATGSYCIVTVGGTNYYYQKVS